LTIFDAASQYLSNGGFNIKIGERDEKLELRKKREILPSKVMFLCEFSFRNTIIEKKIVFKMNISHGISAKLVGRKFSRKFFADKVEFPENLTKLLISE
jgi:hypothetical protein